jgi:porin
MVTNRKGLNVARSVIEVFLAVAVMTFAAGFSAVAALEEETPILHAGSETTPALTASAPPPGWLERDTLTGGWGGVRRWLTQHGITLKPRLTQFYQGMPSGEGDHDFEYGGKADLLLDANLSKLGLWKGLSLTVHAEYNFGESVNQRGGTLMPVNTALMFPGMEGADAFDFSSVTLNQTFGDSVSLLAGKISIIDYCVSKPFMGGDGIDSFWNIVFAAPPSGTVPAYFLGSILSVRTEPATYSLWVYDPNSSVNTPAVEDAFADGVTIRGSVSFPVTIAGRSGHQGFAASYSNKEGTDLETLDDIYLPPFSSSVVLKNDRYYFNYTFDQYLYQSQENPKEGVGLFGQFGISDGNPNKLHWMAFGGVGGTGLIPGRSSDNWGVGYYYAAWSPDLKDSLEFTLKMWDEQGWEIFYNFAVTRWLVLGADLQIINPSLADETAVFCGLRTVVRF